MKSFLVKRILQAVGVVFCISLITFFILNIIPGDPVRIMIGDMADETTVMQVRHQFGLDRPVPDQFVAWFTNMLHGDLGVSYTQNKPVMGLMMKAFAITAQLAGLAYLLALILGITIGVLAALHRGTWIDRTLMALSIFGISAPYFGLPLCCKSSLP